MKIAAIIGLTYTLCFAYTLFDTLAPPLGTYERGGPWPRDLHWAALRFVLMPLEVAAAALLWTILGILWGYETLRQRFQSDR